MKSSTEAAVPPAALAPGPTGMAPGPAGLAAESMVVLGQVGKSFGLTGAFKARLHPEFFEVITGIKQMLVSPRPSASQAVSVTVTDCSLKGNDFCLRFSGYTTPEQIKGLANHYLLAPETVITDLAHERLFTFQVIGMNVVDRQHGDLGTVTEIFDFNGNQCLELEVDGCRKLVPYRPEFIIAADRTAGVLTTEFPAALIDNAHL